MALNTIAAMLYVFDILYGTVIKKGWDIGLAFCI